ncbi:4Fe-4S dicluster domain-containing protein [Anaerotruncus sp. AF02-27]|jgi:carbon-monoxide dehydrogenase iron sulfur subunit|uniref:4Fe-4S dicluster domain-containing protein n=1 Tax=Anaerotruncus TaxID=244127 RepID=UPI000E54BE65|nr:MULTISPECIES: 4Fe-4S dicluster domain-containing protein [Anaerotruncus]RGX56899.1 4Fe-4S dicluster domain-containing protein [Anaerotruncus sp. AF02-27]
MKRIYVNEKWCLGCHLCEYYCAFANSGQDDMVKALKDITINPRIQIEQRGNISFAVSCRHCDEPLCVKGCITGALTIEGGVITIGQEKCVGCYTCIMSCPYGAIMPSSDHRAIQKCELCTKNNAGEPACVKGCPNKAIVYEERGTRG